MKRSTMGACAAAVLVAGAWGCEAGPVPDPGTSELWNEVHGKRTQRPAARTAPKGPPSGKVEFSETSVDIGDVDRGELAGHTFTITNKTDAVLHIKNVRGS